MVHALTDFGSTFTKVALVHGGTGTLLATAQHPTTVATDVVEGYERAKQLALDAAGVSRVDHELAASSAAGGLRMVAVGLVDDLTAAAARRSALTAGAKVEGVLSGRLGGAEVAVLRRAAPDIVLFAGGTDGGERARVVENARAVAEARSGAAVVVACNRDAAEEVAEWFARTGHQTVVVDNVLPGVDRECSGPAREAVREIFIRRVVRAKGLSAAATFFRAVVMPTPAAVLAGAELLASGSDQMAGCGTVLVVDVGGATTDVHSVITRSPGPERVARAAPAPAASARTVEGDLGVRWSAGAVHHQDAAWLAQEAGLEPQALLAAVDHRVADPAFVPDDEAQRRVDRALAASCMARALARHVGRLSTRYVPGEGAEIVLDGRDLRDATRMVVTGGSVVRDADGAERTVATAVARVDASHPVPRSAAVTVDRRYVVAAAGLLSTVDRDAALRLLREEVPDSCAAAA